jgi:hypothetical protein
MENERDGLYHFRKMKATHCGWTRNSISLSLALSFWTSIKESDAFTFQ